MRLIAEIDEVSVPGECPFCSPTKESKMGGEGGASYRGFNQAPGVAAPQVAESLCCWPGCCEAYPAS